MYVVTNRRLIETATGLDVFDKVPNPKGPNELRLVKVVKAGAGFKTNLQDDKLAKAQVATLKKRFQLNIDETVPWYASLRIACELNVLARKKNKHLLLYVHGYNNDMPDVIGTCMALEQLYNIIVVPYSWPANGGGAAGTAAYLSDKRDARASADALNRTIEKLGFYHDLLTAARRDTLKAKASQKHPNNPQACQEYYAELLDADCKVTVNLLCHSMGNYLLKYALMPGAAASRKLVFDNIGLVAADANNKEHEHWVDALQPRNRLYVVMNEDDFALKWSRRKPGDEQLARLGHYLKNLVARSAYYVNVTNASWVKNAHTYFTGTPVQKNADLKQLFQRIVEGDTAEDLMRYHPEANYYVLK